MSTTANQKRRRAERTQEFLATLTSRYPLCFSAERAQVRPVAIGIEAAINADLAADREAPQAPRWLIKQALARYTRSPAYVQAVLDGYHRIDLAGEDAGAPTTEAIEHARGRRQEQQAARKRRAKAARESKPQAPLEVAPEKLDALARRFDD